MEIVILANGIKVKHVELVGTILLMEIFITELGKIIYMMDMELRFYLTIASIKDSFLKEKDISLVLISLLMVVFIMEVSMKIRYKETEYSRKKMEKNIFVIG